MNIVLIGYRGSGKSTVGRALAEQLGWPFIDTDAIIQERTGMTIREIFGDRAEGGFRDLECEVVAEVSRLDRHVISTGGGVVLREENVKALRERGKLVYLTAPPEVLWRRIFEDVHRHSTRLKMDADTGLQQVRRTLLERDPIYIQASDCIVDTSDRQIDSIVRRITTRTGLVQP